MEARSYYNEIDPFAAQWLRNLILCGEIADGDVDTRSIEDVRPDDLDGYTQCHFFAGLGGWSLALRLAGWPDSRPVWTGSCPCQPFSQAGAQRGFADERHLWPVWRELIAKRRPPVVFGEQVASPLARAWLAAVRTDMEADNYAIGAGDICAAGAGAPHIRQRIYWVADDDDAGRSERAQRDGTAPAGRSVSHGDNAGGRSGLGHHHTGLEGRSLSAGGRSSERTPWTPSDFVWCRDGKWRPVEPGAFPLAHGAAARVGRLRAYGNAIVAPLAAEFIGAYLDV